MIQRIAVIGAGQMGSGVAQVAAQSGFDVHVSDVSEDMLKKGKSTIEKNLERLLQKEKITDTERSAVLSRVHMAVGLEGVKSADLVIEAATEKVETKLALFTSLDQLCKPETILATNTSSIPITKIGAATRRPEKVIGMHFMNPVPVMKLVEVIKGLRTSEASFHTVVDVAKTMGKETVSVEDFPGFLVNRILCPMINEAVFALEQGIASAEDIDKAMKLGTNQPMGPLELADFIGLDTCLYIMEVLHEGLGEDKFRPSPLLRRYVQAGLLGKKTGQGFYTY